jgi:hypothetical protein
MIWETSMKTYMKRVDLLESNNRAIYTIDWGQCSPMMQSKVESLDAFESKSSTCDCIWLLKEIQGITHRFEGTRNVFISLDDAWSNYYCGCRQEHKQTLHEYLKDFQGLVQVLEHYGAALGAEGPYQDSVKAQVRKDKPGLTTAEYNKRAVVAAKQKYVAIGFLKRADRKRYGGLWSDLENQFTQGTDDYPSNLTGAYNLLLDYTAPPSQQYGRRKNRAEEEEISGITFLQSSAPVPGTNGATHERIKCYNYQNTGHYASTCPQETQDQQGVQLLQVVQDSILTAVEDPYVSEFTFLQVEEVPDDFTFHQSNTCYKIIPNIWILLDSQSTVSVFKNGHLLLNIRASNKKLRVHTNGGVQISSLVGMIKNFEDVWFNADSLVGTYCQWQLSAKSAASPWTPRSKLL